MLPRSGRGEVGITPQGLERPTELEQAIEPVYRRCRTLSEEEGERLDRLLDKLRGRPEAARHRS